MQRSLTPLISDGTIAIVDEKLTEEQLDNLVESGQAQDVIKQALISENLLDAVAEVEERHMVPPLIEGAIAWMVESSVRCIGNY